MKTYGSTRITNTRKICCNNSDSTEKPNNISFDSRTKSIVNKSYFK